MTKKREIIETFDLKIENLLEDYDSLLGDVMDSGKDPRLELNIDATHSGRLTNNRVYPGVIVRDSANTFLKPKPRPVLKNHNDGADPIGRVLDAKFVQLKQGKAFENDYKRPTTGPGSGVIQLDIAIMDFDAMQKFLDGRFQEFSTRQSFDGLYCSLCGNDFSKDYCGHYPGGTVTVEGKGKAKDKEYNVYAITGPLTYREVSVVNIAGDSYTNINEMNMSEDSLSEDWTFSSKDQLEHDINKLSLASSVSDFSLDLLSSGTRQSVSAKDREKLTGKTVVSMAGPDFKNLEIIHMDKNKTQEEVKDEKVEDLNVNEKNADDTASSKDGVEGKSNQDSTEQGKGEGVEAPKTDTEDKTDETTVSDKAVADASLKALAIVNKGLETEVKDLKLEIERVKGDLTAKDEEVERLRESTADAQTKLKESTARQLLDNKLVLGKPEVADVNGLESYNEKLAELSKRSLESLNDALTDLSIEISQFKGQPGSTKFLNAEVKSPVADVKSDSSVNESDKETKLTPIQKRASYLDSHL